jgi:hypothetical protein
MPAHLTPAAPSASSVPFGPGAHNHRDVSLAAALHERSGRRARAGAIRYQLAMGLVGFLSGLTLILPLVLWMAPEPAGAPIDADQDAPSLMTARPSAADATALRALIDAPAAAPSDETPVTPVAVPGLTIADDAVEKARGLIRAGDIREARTLLSRPGLAQSGQALFMLAETYDPNVLAALGAMGVHADAALARRYYEAALDIGVAAAAPRLEALE